MGIDLKIKFFVQSTYIAKILLYLRMSDQAGVEKCFKISNVYIVLGSY